MLLDQGLLDRRLLHRWLKRVLLGDATRCRWMLLHGRGLALPRRKGCGSVEIVAVVAVTVDPTSRRLHLRRGPLLVRHLLDRIISRTTVPARAHRVRNDSTHSTEHGRSVKVD